MTKDLHVLHVVGAMNIGGIENMLMTLMPYMKTQGIVFDFAVHGENIGFHEKEIEKLGGHVYHLPKFYGVNIFTYVKAWRCLLNVHPELAIIHGHMTSTASIYLWIAKKMRRITVAHSHSTSTSGGIIIYYIKRFMEYPLRYISDYICSCSTEAAEYRFGSKVTTKNNYFLWRNAIDVRKFYFSPVKREEYRRKLNIPDKAVVLGHVGRMIPAKNHSYLLEIFKEYQFLNGDSKLLLVGDGPLRKKIEQEAKELEVNVNTVFVGAVDDPENYLSVMDVFCFPSKYEGLPISLIEAQINGRICFCADNISHEVKIANGLRFLSTELSAKEWANEIKKSLNYQGMNEIDNKYDVNVVSREIKKFYMRIVI